jgi:two-component system OmpR family response regulator
VARIRARLRVARPKREAQDTAEFNGWTAHFDRYLLVASDGTEVALSHAEGEVLRLFLEAPSG